MAERPAFQDTQYGFAAHLRDPEHNPAPANIEDRRMAIYRELFFNNVAGLLGRTFPVLHKILGAERWKVVMRDYFSVVSSRASESCLPANHPFFDLRGWLEQPRQP